ncbi:MAG: DUF1365 family protein [Caulobacteraceae bacterium]
MTRASAIYVGRVGHARLRSRRHVLSYGVFMLLLDLDELQALDEELRWFSLGRFNLTSFRARDHGDGSDVPLRTQVEAHLDAADLGIAGGPIRLLCLPRVLGYVFNPLSVYFCHRQDGRLRAILYEVNSTFGERHSYLMPAEPDGHGVIRQIAAKRLHVSPFMDMGLDYAFTVTPPGEHLRIAIDAGDIQGPVLAASFAACRKPLTDASLLAAWAAYPLLTLKVIAAIHWEAACLLAKGVHLRSGTPAPAAPVSLGVLRCPQADRR